MKNNAGFTLIEMLIAVVILAIMSGMIYVSFSSVVNTMDIARVNAQDLEARRFLQENIAHNLRAIYSDAACADPSFQLLSEDESGAFGDADTLRFVASLPMPGAGSMPGQYIEVLYELTESYAGEGEDDLAPTDTEAPSGYVLRISEKPLTLKPIGTDFEVDAFEYEPRVREVPINSINYRFYDGIAEEWLDEWDSLAEQRMPWSIEVSVYFARGQDAAAMDYQAGINAGENPDMTMLITLPIGAGTEEPFIDWNHVRNIEEMDNTMQEGANPVIPEVPLTQ